MIIKVLLLVSLGAVVLVALRTSPSGNHLALRRIATAVLALAAVMAVLFPDALTVVANSVGVGRGADLLLYGLVILYLFTTIGLHQRLRTLERRLETFAREVALGSSPVDREPE